MNGTATGSAAVRGVPSAAKSCMRLWAVPSPRIHAAAKPPSLVAATSIEPPPVDRRWRNVRRAVRRRVVEPSPRERRREMSSSDSHHTNTDPAGSTASATGVGALKRGALTRNDVPRA